MKVSFTEVNAKSSNTKDSSQPPTIKSIARSSKGQFLSGRRNWRHSGSKTEESRGHRFGGFTLISMTLRREEGYRLAYVQCKCGSKAWRSYDSLRAGKTSACQQCRADARKSTYPQWLARRFHAARARCTDPEHPQFKNYGERGVKFLFSSAGEAAQWMMDHCGLQKDREIDRISNDGHYEAGNLKWSSKSEQMLNNRRTKVPRGFNYRENEWPYSKDTTLKYVRAGMSRGQILQMAREAVAAKRKNWRGIQKRLESMIS